MLTYPLATVLIGKILSDQESQERSWQALQASEEKYRLAMDATNDGLWDWNPVTNRVNFSPAWGRILGIDSVTPELTTWKSRIHPDDQARVLDLLEAHLRGESDRWEVEHRFAGRPTANGNGCWGRGQVVARDHAGKPLRVAGTMIDISPRKWIEDTLRESESKYRHIVEYAPLGIFQQELGRYLSLCESGKGETIRMLQHRRVSGKIWQDIPAVG